MVILERDDVVNTMNAVVAELGEDFVYSKDDGGSCYYFADERNPLGCIVGAVLVRHGIEPTTELLGSSSWIAQLELDDELKISESAKTTLAVAQRLQDQGRTWGVARDAGVAAGEVAEEGA